MVRRSEKMVVANHCGIWHKKVNLYDNQWLLVGFAVVVVLILADTPVGWKN